MSYTPSYSKDDMIKFIKKNIRVSSSTKLRTFKEIKEQLKTIEESRKNQIHHEEWYDDEILQQIEEYLEDLEPKMQKEEDNIQTTKNVSLVARKGKHPVNYDVEGIIQEFSIQGNKTIKKENKTVKKGGKMKKKSIKSKKTRNTRKNKIR